MKIKVIATVLLLLFLASTISMAFNVTPVSANTTITDAYVSDTSDDWWAGATSEDIDGSGYVVPPSGSTWNDAVFCWEHSSWNTNLNPAGYKAELFATPAADWIWKAYQVSLGESYTGDIVFFKKRIHIPDNAFNIDADLFIVTADNAYYFYVNDEDWSGTPVGQAGFVGAYGPTDFYYTSDGVTNLGGGTNSVPYETDGNVYPKDATIDTAVGAWSTIELWDISAYLDPGENWLQIVAINEPAPPPRSNEQSCRSDIQG